MLTLVRSIVSVLACRFRSRAVLKLEVLALRHQLNVLGRQRPGRLRLFANVANVSTTSSSSTSVTYAASCLRMSPTINEPAPIFHSTRIAQTHARSSHAGSVYWPPESADVEQAQAPAALYRTGKSMGERLLRIVQQQAQGRTGQRRDLLLSEGGTDHGRALAHPLQHAQAALLARLPPASAAGGQPSDRGKSSSHSIGKSDDLD